MKIKYDTITVRILTTIMSFITNQIQDSLYVLISLDSLAETKSLKYHNLILEELHYFNQYNIPIWIITPDNEQFLNHIRQVYNFDIHYLANPSLSHYKTNNLIKNKQIYGKEYMIIYTNLKVINENKVIYNVNRINEKSLKMAYLKALEELFKIYKKNFKKLLTRI